VVARLIHLFATMTAEDVIQAKSAEDVTFRVESHA
jgi:hypothetical protein